MKKVLLLSFVFIQTIGYSQKSFLGKYCFSFEAGYTCIKFLDNQRFEYSSGSCLGEESKGSGNHKVVNNKLILTFDKTEKVYHSIVKTESVQTNSKDSIKLNFYFFDAYKKELPFVNLEKDSTTSFRADQYGELQIIEAKYKSENTYKISSIGYEVLPIKLKMDTDKKITIYLSQWKPKVISDKTIEYELIEIQDDYFKILDNLSYYKNGLIFKKVE